MTIHEFGKENKRTVALIHPSLVKWDYFERVIPLLERKYVSHLKTYRLKDHKGQHDMARVIRIFFQPN